MNVLLLSAGRRVELVRSFQQAYRRLGIDGIVVATDLDPLAPALQVADRGHLVPQIDSPEYMPAIEEICVQESIRLVLPLIDPDILVLANHEERLRSTGAKIGVVDPHAAVLTGDKWLAYQWFREIDLATPNTWLPEEIDVDNAHFPLFIKPRNGSAGHHAFEVRNAHELSFLMTYVDRPIIQDHLPGPEITTDVICDTNGTVLAIISRQRIEVRAGEAMKSVTIDHPQIKEACLRIAQSLPACGPITVQCMLEEGVPYFIEINARLGGGVPLAIAAGVDVPGLILSRLAASSSEAPKLASYRSGVYMTRCDESLFIMEEERVQLARDRIRSG